MTPLLALLALLFADFVCPMDPDVRSSVPGRCPRCRMKLVAGLPVPLPYPVRITAKPDQLTLEVLHPKTDRPVTTFNPIHEKLFHLFIVDSTLNYFAHEHPTLAPDGRFHLDIALPKASAYRVLCDFYPSGGTPQMSAQTIFTPGYHPPATLAPPHLHPELAPQSSVNLRVKLHMEPAQPIAGQKTLLFFTLEPADGLEEYLGAWGHMLAVSDDLIDAIHAHPFLASGGPEVQFNMIFPRAAVYRVWVQFQRRGEVNTVAFNIPVVELE